MRKKIKRRSLTRILREKNSNKLVLPGAMSMIEQNSAFSLGVNFNALNLAVKLNKRSMNFPANGNADFRLSLVTRPRSGDRLIVADPASICDVKTVHATYNINDGTQDKKKAQISSALQYVFSFFLQYFRFGNDLDSISRT